ncbi:MAG: SulP family inorganic anion transporter, partial [Nitrospirae bacterium]
MHEFGLKRFFPFLSWLPELRYTWKNDLFAGLIGAIVVLPQGVAFAMIAGMPPQYGLYAAMVPAIVAALFGSSRHLISGPTTAISLVLYSTLLPMAEPGSQHYIELALLLTFMAGLFQLSMGIARLGGLINFVSHSVVLGFTAGASILIITSQLKHLFGLHYKNAPHFIENVELFIEHLKDFNSQTLIVGIITLIVVIVVRRALPKWPGVGMFAGMITGGALTFLEGWQKSGVRVVGALPSAIPSFSTPLFSLNSIKILASGALVISMLGLMEAVSIARSVALKSGQRIDGNQEFIGQGLSNIVGSFFSAYACSGSFTRTGVNYQAGAKTAAAGIFAALWLMAILLFVKDLAAYIPIASMAAVILVVAYNLVDFHHIRTIVKLDLTEAAVLAVTFLATLFLELEFAIYVGAFLSIGIYLNRTAATRVLVRVPDPHTRQFVTDPNLPQCPQLCIIRIEGDLYFAAMTYVESQIAELSEKLPENIKLFIVLPAVNHIDVTGIDSIIHIVEERRKKGGDVYFYGMNPYVMKIFKKSGAVKLIGEDHIFRSK